MSNPSYQLLERPQPTGNAGDVAVRFRVWTSRGNSTEINRVLPFASAPTPAQLGASLKTITNAIESAETTALGQAPVPPPFPYTNRYDATKAVGTVLDPADTPADTGKPPAGGG